MHLAWRGGKLRADRQPSWPPAQDLRVQPTDGRRHGNWCGAAVQSV